MKITSVNKLIQNNIKAAPKKQAPKDFPEVVLPRQMGQFEANIIRFLQSKLHLDITPLNAELWIDRLDDACQKLSDKQFDNLHKLYFSNEKVPMTQNMMSSAFSAVYKLVKVLGLVKNLSFEEKIAVMKKYPHKFSSKELELMKIKYRNPQEPLRNDMIESITDIPAKTLKGIYKNIEDRIWRLGYNNEQADNTSKRISFVRQHYEARKHLLSKQQQEVLELRLEQNLILSRIAKILNYDRHYAIWLEKTAIQVLSGEKEVSAGLVRQMRQDKYLQLLHEKKELFSKEEFLVLEKFFTGRNGALSMFASENNLNYGSVKRIKQRAVKILKNTDMQEYRAAKQKLKECVSALYSAGKFDTPRVKKMAEEYILSDNPKSMSKIFPNSRQDAKAKSVIIEILEKEGIKSDIAQILF